MVIYCPGCLGRSVALPDHPFDRDAALETFAEQHYRHLCPLEYFQIISGPNVLPGKIQRCDYGRSEVPDPDPNNGAEDSELGGDPAGDHSA
jgi:hypothetical protein